MSGLRIVLEETDTASMLRSEEAIAMRQPDPVDANSESLLPPLPETEEEMAPAVASPLVPTASVSSAFPPAAQRRPSASPRVLSSPSTLKEHQQYQGAAGIQGLDLSSLNMDSSPFSFPSIDPPSPVQTPFPSVLSKSHSSTSINTSPLKRLKSLKNGLRRLSLSRKGSSASSGSQMGDLTVTASTPAVLQSALQPSQGPSNLSLGSKPSIFPIHTDTYLNDASSLSSTAESLRSSTFSSSVPASTTGQNTHTGTPIGPSHIHTSSQGSSIVGKPRRRTISQSNSATSTTPPLPSPIITLSENLSSTKRNLVSIEQNFFENLHSMDSESQEAAVDRTVDTISMLDSSDDLIDYSVYLSQHKKSVEAAYEVSKSKLSSSGWCSGQDIENLVLHRDSVLSQIDSKLLKIEEKLNADFKVSILNNPQVELKSQPQQTPAIKASLSPSLKDLESRCLFSTNNNILS